MSRRNTIKLVATLLATAALSACASKPVDTRPDVLFREGEAFMADRKYDDAIAQWKRVKESYASPELTTLAELKIADAQFDNQSYIEAAASYEEFRKLHPKNPQADYALYRLGLANYQQITGIDTDQTPVKNAIVYFDEFLKEYPKSKYAEEVKEKRDVCITKELQHEIYVARFYYRTGKYQAAIKRLEEALVRFPKHLYHDETYYYLGAAYLRSGDRDKAREVFNKLQDQFPNSKYIDEARKLLEKYY